MSNRIQIRPDILSGLIWVQTVASYQQMTLVEVNPFPAIQDLSVLSSLLMQFGSLYCKHYEDRSDRSLGNILIRVYSVHIHDKKHFWSAFEYMPQR